MLHSRSHSFKISLFLVSLFLVAVPLVVAAQGTPAEAFIGRVGLWVGLATPILSGIALLVFVWGIVKFIFYGGDEEKRKEGKKFMGWSIVALFVLVSIFGIIQFLETSIYGPGTSIPTRLPPPCIEGVPGSDCGNGGGAPDGGDGGGFPGDSDGDVGGGGMSEEPECSDIFDCPDAGLYDCINGQCVNISENPEECQFNDDCSRGEYCSGGTCVDDPFD